MDAMWCYDQRMAHTAMDKEIRSIVKYANMALEIWNDLHERFGKESAPRGYELKQSITQTRQEGTSISAYYTKLSSIWDEIDSILLTPWWCVFSCKDSNTCYEANTKPWNIILPGGRGRATTKYCRWKKIHTHSRCSGLSNFAACWSWQQSSYQVSSTIHPLACYISYDKFFNRHKSFLADIMSHDEPKTLFQASQDEKWW